MHGRSFSMVKETERTSKCNHKTLGNDSNVGPPSPREKPDAEVETWTPLPKASYTVLKDKQIRDLLAAQDLSTTGDRSQLISRHER